MQNILSLFLSLPSLHVSFPCPVLSFLLPSLPLFLPLSLSYSLSRNNRLSDLPAQLQSCVHLKDIILSYNLLQMLPSVLYDIPTLENIIANDNQIEIIDVFGLKKLPVLSCLDLHNNSINSVPPELGTITSLRYSTMCFFVLL